MAPMVAMIMFIFENLANAPIPFVAIKTTIMNVIAELIQVFIPKTVNIFIAAKNWAEAIPMRAIIEISAARISIFLSLYFLNKNMEMVDIFSFFD